MQQLVIFVLFFFSYLYSECSSVKILGQIDKDLANDNYNQSHSCFHGYYNYSTGVCTCYNGWIGTNCSVSDQSSTVLMNSEKHCPISYNNIACGASNSNVRCIKSKSPCLYNDPECFIGCDCDYGSGNFEISGRACSFTFKDTSPNNNYDSSTCNFPTLISKNYLTQLFTKSSTEIPTENYSSTIFPIGKSFNQLKTNYDSIMYYFNALISNGYNFNTDSDSRFKSFPYSYFFTSSELSFGDMNLNLASYTNSDVVFSDLYFAMDNFVTFNNRFPSDQYRVCALNYIYHISTVITNDLSNLKSLSSTTQYSYREINSYTFSSTSDNKCGIDFIGFSGCSSSFSSRHCYTVNKAFDIDYSILNACRCDSSSIGLGCAFNKNRLFESLQITLGKLKYIHQYRGETGSTLITNLITNNTSFTCPNMKDGTEIVSYQNVLDRIQTGIDRISKVTSANDLHKLYFSYIDSLIYGFISSTEKTRIDSASTLVDVVAHLLHFSNVLVSNIAQFEATDKHYMFIKLLDLVNQYILNELDLGFSCNYGRYNISSGLCECPTGYSGMYCQIKSGDSNFVALNQINCHYNIAGTLCGGNTSTASTCIRSTTLPQMTHNLSGYCSCSSNSFGLSCSFSISMLPSLSTIIDNLINLYPLLSSSLSGEYIHLYNRIINFSNYLNSLNLPTNSELIYENLKVSRLSSIDLSESGRNQVLSSFYENPNLKMKFSRFQSISDTLKTNASNSNVRYYNYKNSNIYYNRNFSTAEGALTITVPSDLNRLSFYSSSGLDVKNLNIGLNYLVDNSIYDGVYLFMKLEMYHDSNFIAFSSPDNFEISFSYSDPRRLRCYHLSNDALGNDVLTLQNSTYNYSAGAFTCYTNHFSYFVVIDSGVNKNYRLFGFLFLIPVIVIALVEFFIYRNRFLVSNDYFKLRNSILRLPFYVTHFFRNFHGRMRLKYHYTLRERISVCVSNVIVPLSFIFNQHHYFYYSWFSTSMILLFLRIIFSALLTFLYWGSPAPSYINFFGIYAAFYTGFSILDILWKHLRLFVYNRLNNYTASKNSEISDVKNNFKRMRFRTLFTINLIEILIYSILFIYGIATFFLLDTLLFDIFIREIGAISIFVIVLEVIFSLVDLIIYIIISGLCLSENSLRRLSVIRKERSEKFEESITLIKDNSDNMEKGTNNPLELSDFQENQSSQEEELAVQS